MRGVFVELIVLLKKKLEINETDFQSNKIFLHRINRNKEGIDSKNNPTVRGICKVCEI